MSVVEVERVDGVPVAHVAADVDAANVGVVHDQLAAALGPDASRLIVDLTGVRYLDSAALDMLLRLASRLEHRRARLILVIPADSQINKLVAIVGLAQAVEIAPLVSTALHAAARTAGGLGP